MSEIMVSVFLQISDLFHLIAPKSILHAADGKIFLSFFLDFSFLMTKAFEIFIFNCGKYP